MTLATETRGIYAATPHVFDAPLERPTILIFERATSDYRYALTLCDGALPSRVTVSRQTLEFLGFGISAVYATPDCVAARMAAEVELALAWMAKR